VFVRVDGAIEAAHKNDFMFTNARAWAQSGCRSRVTNFFHLDRVHNFTVRSSAAEIRALPSLEKARTENCAFVSEGGMQQRVGGLRRRFADLPNTDAVIASRGDEMRASGLKATA